MRKLLAVAGLTAVVSWAAVAAPAGAQQEVTAAAVQECQQERHFDRQEFRRDYGGTGAQALRRCVREELREARRECREERREDPAEYRRDYGRGDAAFARCVIDEIR